MHIFSKEILLFSLLAAPVAVEAHAADGPTLSGTVALVSDYRFRGVSLSDEDIAVQGGLGLQYGAFNLGAWASSIEDFNGAETELDVYAGVSRNIGGVDFSLGAIGYLYPGGDGNNYAEITAAASRNVGPAVLTLGVNYAPKQTNIGRADNVYIYSTAALPIKNTAFSLSGGLGYEDGAFANQKIDWNFSVTAAVFGLDVSLKYYDTDAGGQFNSLGDATTVLSLTKAF